MAGAALDIEQLKSAAERGTDSVKELLTTPAEGGELSEQEAIDNAKQAIQFLQQRKLESLQESAREAIIEASRQILQAAIERVSSQIQVEQTGSSAVERLAELESKKDELIKSRDAAVKLENELAELHERVFIEGREITQDVTMAYKEKNWVELGKFAGLAVGGAAVVKWFYDNTFGRLMGSKEKPGFFRKLFSFAATIGGAALGAVGLKMWQRGELAPVAKDVVDNTLDGLGSGLKKSGIEERIRRIIGLGSSGSMQEVLNNREFYQSDAEFYASLAVAFFEDGGVVIGTGVEHFWHNGKTLAFDSVPGLWDAFKNSIENPMGLVYAHAEGMAIYGTSFGAVQTVIMMGRDGIVPGLKGGLIKTALWEVEFYKGARAITVGLLSPDGWRVRAVAADELYRTPGYRFNRTRAFLNRWGSGDRGKLVDLIAEWRHYANKASSIEGVKGADDIVGRLQARANTIAVDVRRELWNLRQTAEAKGGQAADDLYKVVSDLFQEPKLGEQLKKAGSIGDIDLGYIREKLKSAVQLDEVSKAMMRGDSLEKVMNIALKSPDRALHMETILSKFDAPDLLRAGAELDEVCVAISHLDEADALPQIAKLLDGVDEATQIGRLNALVRAGMDADDLVTFLEATPGQYADDVIDAVRGAANTAGDALAEVVARGGTIEDILRANGSVEDMLHAGHNFNAIARSASGSDEVFRAACRYLDEVDDATRAQYVRTLIDEGRSMQSILDEGVDARRLLDAVHAAAPNTFADDIVTLLDDAVESARVTETLNAIDDLLINGGSIDDALRAGNSLDDVVHVVDGYNDFQRIRYVEDLMQSHNASDLLRAGARVDDVCPLIVARPSASFDMVQLLVDQPLATQKEILRGLQVAGASTDDLANAIGMSVKTEHTDEVVKYIASLSDDAARIDDALRIGEEAVSVIGNTPDARRALERAMQFTGSLDEAVDMARDVVVYEHLADDALFNRLSTLAGATDNPQSAFRTLAHYTRAAEGAAEALDPQILRIVASSGLTEVQDIDSLAKIARSPKLAGDTARISRAMQGYAKWRGAGSFARNLARLGVAAEVVGFAFSAYEAKQAHDRVQKTLENLEAQLIDGGFKRGNPAEGQNPNFFYHPNGTVLELQGIKKAIHDLDNPAKVKATFDGIIAAGSVATLAMAPQILLGPAGWVVLGVQIVYHSSVAIANQNNTRNLLSVTDSSVLAVMGGTGKVLDQSEQAVMSDFSNWVVTDGFGVADQYEEAEKRLIRKRIAMVLFHQEVQQIKAVDPELFRYVTDGKSIADYLSEDGEIFNEGFDTIIRPAFGMALAQASVDRDIEVRDFLDLKIDAGMFDFENVTQTQMRLAMRQAVILYGMHRKEMHARAAIALAARLQEEYDEHHTAPPLAELTEEQQQERAAAQIALQKAVTDAEKLGKQKIYGRTVDELIARRAGGEEVDSETQLLVGNYIDSVTSVRGTAIASTRRIKNPRYHALTVDVLLEKTNGTAFSVPIPEYLLPGEPDRTVNIVQLGEAALEGDQEVQDAVAYDQLLVNLSAVYRTVEHVGTIKGTWFAQESHFRQIKEVVKTIRRSGLSDPETLKALNKMDHADFSNERIFGPIGLGFDKQQMERRNAAMRSAVGALGDYLGWLRGQHYEYHTFERSEQIAHRDPVSGEVVANDLGYRDVIHTGPTLQLLPVDADGNVVDGEPLVLKGKRGQRIEHNCPPPEGMHGQIRCDYSEHFQEFMWTFIGGEQSTFYVYQENRYGAEIPGKLYTFARQEVREEVLDVNTNSYVYPHGTFEAYVTSASGKQTLVSLGMERGVYSKQERAQAEKELAALGVTLQPVDTVRMDRRYEGGAYEIERATMWEFVIDRTKVQSIDLSSTEFNIANPTTLHEERVVTSGTPELPTPPESIELGAGDVLSTHDSADAVLVDGKEFDISITLANGQTVRGTHEFPDQLFRYMDFDPVTVKQQSSHIHNIGGEWYKVDRPQLDGWKLSFREGSSVQLMQIRRSDGSSQFLRFSHPQFNLYGENTSDTEVSVLRALSEDGADSLRALIAELKVDKVPGESFYRMRGDNNAYYPLDDGRLYYEGSDDVPSRLYSFDIETGSVTSSEETLAGHQYKVKRLSAEPAESPLSLPVSPEWYMAYKALGVVQRPDGSFTLPNFTGRVFPIADGKFYRTEGVLDGERVPAAITDGVQTEVLEGDKAKIYLVSLARKDLELQKHPSGYFTQKGSEARFYERSDGTYIRKGGGLPIALYEGGRLEEIEDAYPVTSEYVQGVASALSNNDAYYPNDQLFRFTVTQADGTTEQVEISREDEGPFVFNGITLTFDNRLGYWQADIDEDATIAHCTYESINGRRIHTPFLQFGEEEDASRYTIDTIVGRPVTLSDRLSQYRNVRIELQSGEVIDLPFAVENRGFYQMPVPPKGTEPHVFITAAQDASGWNIELADSVSQVTLTNSLGDESVTLRVPDAKGQYPVAAEVADVSSQQPEEAEDDTEPVTLPLDSYSAEDTPEQVEDGPSIAVGQELEMQRGLFGGERITVRMRDGSEHVYIVANAQGEVGDSSIDQDVVLYDFDQDAYDSIAQVGKDPKKFSDVFDVADDDILSLRYGTEKEQSGFFEVDVDVLHLTINNADVESVEWSNGDALKAYSVRRSSGTPDMRQAA